MIKKKLLKKGLSVGLSLALAVTMMPAYEKNVSASATVNSDGLYVSELPIEKVDGLSEDFFMGADVSSAQTLIDAGVKYYNEDGEVQDLYELMADSGINYVRLRLWNDPYSSTATEKTVINSYGGGVCDINYVTKMALAAQKAGLKVFLDFHYSDFWADPSKQTKPKAWANYTSAQIYDAVYNFTYDSLTALKKAGVNNIGIVQVGNETTSKICGYGYNSTEGMKIFASGCNAVRAFDSSILTAVHFTNQQNFNFKDLTQTFINNGVDIDIMSTSYYPEFSTHGSIESVCNNLAGAKTVTNTKTGKKVDVMVAETGYYYQGITTAKAAQPAYAKYGTSREAQAIFLRDLIAGLNNIGGLGVFYWEPAWCDTGLDYNRTGTGWASDNASEYDKDAAEYGGGKCATTNLALFDTKSSQSNAIFENEVLNVFKYVYKGTTSATDVKSIDPIVVSLNVGDEVILPETANVTLKSFREVNASITWNAEDVAKVDTSKEGDYYVNGVINEYDAEVVATVEVTDKGIISVEGTTIYVAPGGNINLPSTLEATIGGGDKVNVNVAWSESDIAKIDTSIVGKYYVSGNVDDYNSDVFAEVIVAPVAVSSNLVSNPSFELPAVSKSRTIDDWTTESSVGAGDTRPVYMEQKSTYDGTRRLSIWSSSYDDYNAGIYQEIDISEYGAGVYEVSLYQTGNIDNLSLYLKGGDYSSEIISSVKVAPSESWANTSFYVTISNESKVTVGLSATGVAKNAWTNIDLVSVKYCGKELKVSAKDELIIDYNNIINQREDGLLVISEEDADEFENLLANIEVVLDNPDATEDIYKDTLDSLHEFATRIGFAVEVKNNEGVSLDIKDSAKYGEVVTFNTILEDGYELKNVYVFDEAGRAVDIENNAFTMPASKVTVSAVAAKASDNYLTQVLRAYSKNDNKLLIAFENQIGDSCDMEIDGLYGYNMEKDLSYGDKWYKFRIKGGYGSYKIYEVTDEGVNLVFTASKGSTALNNTLSGATPYYYDGKLYATVDALMVQVNKISFTFYVYAPGYSELALMFANTIENAAQTSRFTISGWSGKYHYVMLDASDEIGENWFKLDLTSLDGGFQIYNSSNGHAESEITWIANIGLDGGADLYSDVLSGKVYYVLSNSGLYDNLEDTGVYYYGKLDKPVVTVSGSDKENTFVVNWNKVENATSYEIQIGGTTVATLDGDTTSYIATATYAGNNRINVIAHAKGWYDGSSNSVRVIVPDEIVSANAARVSDTSATLKWTFTSGGDADGFIIYQKEGNGAFKQINKVGVAVSSIDITGLTKDGIYSFKVVPYCENDTCIIYGSSKTVSLNSAGSDENVVEGPKKGTVVKDKKYKYAVTKAGTSASEGEVKITGLNKKTLTSIKVAAKVTIGGITYKVTAVNKNAFKNNKKIKKVTIGKNVKTIGVNAFSGCKKLSAVTINSKVLKTIGKSAFYNCKKLKKVIIKSSKLTKIGKGAFKGIKKKATFKVPKAKKTKYKKMIKKAGAKSPKVK